MREIDASIKVTGHAFMVGEFTAIVIGDGMNSIPMWREPFRDSVPDCLSRLVEDRPDDSVQGLALDQRNQGAPVTLADHGITFPVPESPLGIHNGRAIINRDLVRDNAAPIIGPIALAPGFLATQIPVQFAS